MSSSAFLLVFGRLLFRWGNLDWAFDVMVVAVIRAPVRMFGRNFGGRLVGEIAFVEGHVAGVFIMTLSLLLLKKIKFSKCLFWDRNYAFTNSTHW